MNTVCSDCGASAPCDECRASRPWSVYKLPDGSQHIVPSHKDEPEHLTDPICWCSPKKLESYRIWTHHRTQ